MEQATNFRGLLCFCPREAKDLMCRMTKSCLLPLFAVVLMAAESSWTTKPISQWNVEDAKQVLSNSPWVKTAVVRMLPQRSEAQMRDGGRMGMTQGAGLGALDPSILTGFGGKRLVAKPPKRQTLIVRWESVPAIRGAELKTGDERAPAWDGDYYALAIYDVPGLEDQKTLPVELKKAAFLRRDGKKDLYPVRVDLLFDEKGATVVYLFPRSGEISLEDKRIELVAQIGRMFVAQSFSIEEMQFQGKLEL